MLLHCSRDRVVSGAVPQLQIRQQVQPVNHLLGGLIRLVNELIQLVGGQVQASVMIGVDGRQLFARLGILRMLFEMFDIFCREFRGIRTLGTEVRRRLEQTDVPDAFGHVNPLAVVR